MASGLLVLVIIIALGACAPVPVAVEAGAPGVSGAVAEKPQVLRANGFGTVVPAAELTAGQEKLLAMRASRIDAYRNLAEMLNGMAVVGNTTVRQMATDHDHVRSLVSDIVRGARVVNIEQVDDETYQTIVELTLSRRFYLCLQDPMGSECGVSVGPRGGVRL